MHATAVIGIALAALTAAACNSNSTGVAAGCGSSGAAATVSATDNFVFSPAAVTITHGQSVCWQNMGTISHTVTDNATNGTIFNSNLYAGQTFVHTFPAAGSFGYHCNMHSSMVGGTIIVN